MSLVFQRNGAEASQRLAALHGAAFPEEPWDEASIARLLRGPGAFAVIAAQDTADQAFTLFHTVPPEAELLSIGVRPEARGQGMAEKLLRFAAVILLEAGASSLFLEVASGNTPARALYHRLGFAEVSRRPGYYRSGEDALVMKMAVTGLV